MLSKEDMDMLYYGDIDEMLWLQQYKQGVTEQKEDLCRLYSQMTLTI